MFVRYAETHRAFTSPPLKLRMPVRSLLDTNSGPMHGTMPLAIGLDHTRRDADNRCRPIKDVLRGTIDSMPDALLRRAFAREHS